MRFSVATLEGPLFDCSGFYKGRSRYAERLAMFEHAAFSREVSRKVTWDKSPVSRSALAKEVQALPDENLLVRGIDVVLRYGVSV